MLDSVQAVEKLALGLSRDRMVVLKVPEPHNAAYANLLGCLNSMLSPTVVVCPGSKTLSFRAASACQHSTLLTLVSWVPDSLPKPVKLRCMFGACQLKPATSFLGPHPLAPDLPSFLPCHLSADVRQPGEHRARSSGRPLPVVPAAPAQRHLLPCAGRPAAAAQPAGLLAAHAAHLCGQLQGEQRGAGGAAPLCRPPRGDHRPRAALNLRAGGSPRRTQGAAAVGDAGANWLRLRAIWVGLDRPAGWCGVGCGQRDGWLGAGRGKCWHCSECPV